MPDSVRLSKFLSLVLRHDPAAAGVTLDESGWCDIEAVVAGAATKGFRFTLADIHDVVAKSDKQRFALSADGTRIRANQGHSVEVDLDLEARIPPDTLYHGTVDRFLGPIRAEGLKKMARQHVHLSPDHDTAGKVGQRRGKPVILRVHAKAMHDRGAAFYMSANGVWLVDRVPPEFIEFPE